MMRMRLNEDYYFWCCDWCDSENRVLWTRVKDGATCGACHKPMNLPGNGSLSIGSTLTAGL